MFGLKNKKEKLTVKALKVCFTGHRPKGLPWGYDETKEICILFKNVMFSIIEKAIINGYTYFISGMALGIDMICAEIVLELKKKYKNVMLECAIPCLNQENKWSIAQQERYRKILHKADIVHYVSKEEYSNTCMNDRNNYMVEQSDVVIAVWNGRPNRTGNTVKIAKILARKLELLTQKIPNNIFFIHFQTKMRANTALILYKH